MAGGNNIPGTLSQPLKIIVLYLICRQNGRRRKPKGLHRLPSYKACAGVGESVGYGSGLAENDMKPTGNLFLSVGFGAQAIFDHTDDNIVETGFMLFSDLVHFFDESVG